MTLGSVEQPLVDGFAEVRARAQGLLRGLPADGLTATAASRILDHAVAVEKAMAGVKLLVAERAGRSAEDLSRGAGTSKKQAKDLLDASKKVKDQPQLEGAVRDGDLSERQASAIADAGSVNPSATKGLIDKAKHGSLGALLDACGKAKADADEDQEATQDRIHAGRFFRHGTDTEGAFGASMRGTTGDGSRFMSWFQPFRDAVFEEYRRAGRRDTSEAIDFDALVRMAQAAHGNPSGKKVKPPAQVNVVVNWDTLVNGHQPGGDAAVIAGIGPVPVSVVEEILQDAFLVGLVMHGTEIAKVKRFGRHIPADIRDALLVKHRYRCSTPGCNNWARLEFDHIQPYARGGETSYANLDLPCTTCHKAKTAQDRLHWTGTDPP